MSNKINNNNNNYGSSNYKNKMTYAMKALDSITFASNYSGAFVTNNDIINEFKEKTNAEKIKDKMLEIIEEFRTKSYATERGIKADDILNYSFGGIKIEELLNISGLQAPKFCDADNGKHGLYEDTAINLKLTADNCIDLMYYIVQKAMNDPLFAFEYSNGEIQFNVVIQPTLYVLYNDKYEIRLVGDYIINDSVVNYLKMAIDNLSEEMQCYLALQGINL